VGRSSYVALGGLSFPAVEARPSHRRIKPPNFCAFAEAVRSAVAAELKSSVHVAHLHVLVVLRAPLRTEAR
jgi:hypothetical protein